jgi:hypothetical protein
MGDGQNRREDERGDRRERRYIYGLKRESRGKRRGERKEER